MHRNDIQGLRAVAVLLVVLDHAGVSFLGGGYVGVDVFFVLSGFLITGLLLSRAARDGYVSLPDFYVRRARRILPAAALTLLVTDIVAYALLNLVRARQVLEDSIWASLFAANVHFAREGTDYFASWQPPSPIQHFWTLAVEEQFYVVWPIVLTLVVFGPLGWRRSRGATLTPAAERRLLAAVVVLAGASLAWSIHQTAATPASAYFSTLTRAWELALGAALALVTRRLTSVGERTAPLQTALGWTGLAGIAVAAVVYGPGTPFPGYAALLPAGGAACVIAAGIGDTSRYSAGRVLSVGPMRYVGDRSYAYYLWHWPVLIIAAQYAGHGFSTGENLLLAVGAFGLSVISYRLFENPLRQMRWPVPGGVLAWPVSAAVVIGVALFTIGAIDGKTARADAAAAAVAKPPPLRDPSAVEHTQAAPLPAVVAAVKLATRGAPIPKGLVPPVGKLLEDGYALPQGCSPNSGETKSQICRLGDTSAGKTLVVFGDSFALHWMPAVLSIAQKDGWLVVPVINASGCATSAWLSYPSRPWCPKWYRWAVAQAKALHPDVTLLAGEWGPDTPATAAPGAIAGLAAAKRYSRSVVTISIPPFQEKQPVDCLLAKRATMKTCTTIITPAMSYANDDKVVAYAKSHGVGVIATKPWFCAIPAGAVEYWCPLVINRTITHIDPGHVTVSYVNALTGSFRAAFRRALFS